MDREGVINVLREDVVTAQTRLQDVSDNFDLAIRHHRDPYSGSGSLERVRMLARSYFEAVNDLKTAQLRLKRFETGVLPHQVRPRPPQRLVYSRTSKKSA